MPNLADLQAKKEMEENGIERGVTWKTMLFINFP